MNKYKATLDKKGTVSGSLSGEKSMSRPDKYTFTPQDFKYDNKHYKYIKYTKSTKVTNDYFYNIKFDKLFFLYNRKTITFYILKTKKDKEGTMMLLIIS